MSVEKKHLIRRVLGNPDATKGPRPGEVWKYYPPMNDTLHLVDPRICIICVEQNRDSGRAANLVAMFIDRNRQFLYKDPNFDLAELENRGELVSSGCYLQY